MNPTPENLAEEILEELGPEALVQMNIALENSMAAIEGLEGALIAHMETHPKMIFAPLTNGSVAFH